MRNALDIISKLFEDEDVPVNTSVELEAPAPILTLSASDTAEDVEAMKAETEEVGIGEPALGAEEEPISQEIEEPLSLDVAESALCLINRLLGETQAGLTMPSSKSNGKTGPIPVSTTSARTCPPSCPLSGGGGCYAGSGPLALHWKKITSKERGTDWGEFCEIVAGLPENQLWRHNQAGDLPGVGERINAREFIALVEANRGKRGYTYTHKYNSPENVKLIKFANDNGFTVNLSANSPAHADELLALDAGPVATVVPSDRMENFLTPEGNRVVICPAITREGVTCETCGLCQKQRSVIIGFPAHGTSKKKASAIASDEGEPVAQDKLNDIIGNIRGAAF